MPMSDLGAVAPSAGKVMKKAMEFFLERMKFSTKFALHFKVGI